MHSRPKFDQFRKLILFLLDIVLFAVLDTVFYYSIRFVDSHLSVEHFLINSAILLVTIFGVRAVAGIYFDIWRYTNSITYLRLVVADALGGIFALIVSRVFGFYQGVWNAILFTALFDIATISERLCYRIIYKRMNNSGDDENSQKISVAIVGAGQIGALLADELLYNRSTAYCPKFFIDTNPAKIGSRVCGLKVYEAKESILDMIRAQGINEIFIAMSGLDSEKASELYHFYSRTSCKIKLYDTPVRDFSGSENERRSLRTFQIEDLLFRKPLKVNDSAAFRFYTGKKVLVTGGGGSIGSEICRQIAKCNPARLIILDIYENNAYDIQQELKRLYGDKLNLTVLIASVRDRQRLDAIFNAYRPDIVFHAAAHKHVPLMEESCCEAIKNNVFGTYNTADMAEKYGVEKFIMVSTDKAVNPTNVMGASKRLCEMIVQSRVDSKTSFAAVRFGNVLGSNGSVIPLFRRQIESGGPITITDKRIIRYFMTIPEASQLVIQAGAMAKRGELFVLDMGKPVLIYDLAVNMIRLSGLTPHEDIKIEEIGLRPGEKLYEELLIQTEKLKKTDNNMIFIEKDQPLPRETIEEKLALLRTALQKAEEGIDQTEIKDTMHKVVPTFVPPESVNEKAEDSKEMKMVNGEQPLTV